MKTGLSLLVAGLLPCVAHAQGYEAAMKAEIEQLDADKAALSSSLAQTRANTAAARAALDKQIEGLTAKLTRARADNATHAQRLPEAERMRSLEAQARQMAQITGQMRAWFATREVEIPEATPLEDMLEAALGHLETKGGLHEVRGEYFSEAGLAETGALLKIAEVGALVRGARPRPLVLLGDGSLRVAEGVATTHEAVPAGEVLSVVLFDPREVHTPHSYHRETWLEWMHKGGLIMWPLAALGLIGVLLSLERAVALLLAGARVQRFARQIARDGSAHARYTGDRLLAPAALVLASSGPPEALEEKAAEALLHAKPALRRGVSFLGIIAAVAPLIGLLGTVTGMIRTFSVITEHGTGDPRLLSAGISEALLTTQLGLTIAVPALLLHTALLRWSHVVLAAVERLCVRLIAEKGEPGDG